ncbi:MAG: ATP-binding protein, partial [Lentisphaeria bacterium]|nr:ATP-binding protein [Lentisphaeria bacterium]
MDMDSLLGHRLLHALANPAVWEKCDGGASAANGTLDCWLSLEPLAREEPVLADVAALGLGTLPCDWPMEQASHLAVDILFDHCLAVFGRHCREEATGPNQKASQLHRIRKIRSCRLEPDRLVFQVDLHWIRLLLQGALSIPPLQATSLSPPFLAALAQGYRKALRTGDRELSQETLLECLLHELQCSGKYPEWPWKELFALTLPSPSIGTSKLYPPQTAVTCPTLARPAFEGLLNAEASDPEFIQALLPADTKLPEFQRLLDDICEQHREERRKEKDAESKRRGGGRKRARSPKSLGHGPETPAEDLFQEEIPHHTLDDVILPPGTASQIADLTRAITHRSVVLEKWGLGKLFDYGQGLTALFEGPSGTGKTHCARALAGELSYRLVTVNLAQVENRYIGESEKNLQRIFDEADSETILFFDEADAFFTCRSDSDAPMTSHINRMVCVLLREMERFDGTLILATNRSVSLDSAFERRIAYRIHFPRPDVEQRSRIWQSMLAPDSLPVATELDMTELAEHYDLTGGQIKTVVLNAAFAAAE